MKKYLTKIEINETPAIIEIIRIIKLDKIIKLTIKI